MSILVIGGAGFIGRRMIPILAAAGHDITCMDIDVAGATAAFARLGDKVKVVRGDVTQFDDVIGAVQEVPRRAADQSLLLHRRACAPRCLQARHPGHGQLLRGGAALRRQAYGVRQLGRRQRPAVAFRRAPRRRDRRAARRDAVRRQQDHQRVAGPRLPPRLRHDDHLRPAGQRDRPRQEVRLDRSRELHVPAGARAVRHFPARRRHALRHSRRGHGGGVRARAARRQAEAHAPTIPAGPRSAWANWRPWCASSCPMPTSASRRRPAAVRSRETS